MRDLPYGDQAHSLDEYANMEHGPVNAPPLNNENIRTTLLQIAKAITTQEKSATAQA